MVDTFGAKITLVLMAGLFLICLDKVYPVDKSLPLTNFGGSKVGFIVIKFEEDLEWWLSFLASDFENFRPLS